MTKKKVLMLSIGYGELGGVGTVTKELAEALNARGDHEVDVLCYWPWKREEGKAPVYFVSAGGRKTEFSSLEDFLKAPEGQPDYDILNLQSHVFSDYYLDLTPNNTITIKSLLERYGAPTVLLTHCLVAREQLVNGGCNSYELSSQRRVMELSDVILHLTEDQQKMAKGVWPDLDQKTKIMGNGTNFPLLMTDEEVESAYAKYAPKGEKLGLYLGRISPEKGVYELAEALHLIKKKHPEFKLLIGGNQKGNEAPLRKIFDETGMKEGKDYQFLGWISDPTEKQKIIRAADYTLLPSHWEHFSMAALESMINYTPVIMTDVEGPRSIFHLGEQEKRTALPIKKIKDSRAIAEAVTYALEHGQEMHEIRERAMTQVYAEHTWNIVADQYAQLFKGVGSRKIKEERATQNKEYGLAPQELALIALGLANKQEKKEMYQLAISEKGENLKFIFKTPLVFNDYFDLLFDLSFNRDFALRKGDLVTAYNLAKEVYKLNPNKENKELINVLEKVR